MGGGSVRGDRGRFFPPKYDLTRQDRDLTQHQRTFGQEVQWYFYDPETSVYDDVYGEGEGSGSGGRRWKGPIPIPVLSAVRQEGFKVISDDGKYVLDSLDLRLSYEQVRRVGLAPDLDQSTETHQNDRIVYDNRVFGIRNIQITGQFEQAGRDVMARVLCVQVRPDELVNDPDFKQWSA